MSTEFSAQPIEVQYQVGSTNEMKVVQLCGELAAISEQLPDATADKIVNAVRTISRVINGIQ